MKKFPTYRQKEKMDCGPASLRIVAKYYNKKVSINQIRMLSGKTAIGVSIYGLAKAAKSIGLKPLAVKINFRTLISAVPLPCIVHWKQNHFIVVYRIEKNCIYISDSALGLITHTKTEFLCGWLYNETRSRKRSGYVLTLRPSPDTRDNRIPGLTK